MALRYGATLWCFSMPLRYGATLCRYAMALRYGMALRNGMALRYDATLWRYSMALRYGSTLWLHYAKNGWETPCLSTKPQSKHEKETRKKRKAPRPPKVGRTQWSSLKVIAREKDSRFG
jgi:hypothetical protein